MKTIATVAMLLMLAGCNRAAVPAGGGNQAANGSAAAGASTATAPPLDRAFMVGRWTDNGDCSNATEFGENGQFQIGSGASGPWSLAGDRLTLAGEQTLTMQVVVVDQNTVDIVNPDGSRGRSTRC
jgi:hypothetical protein